MYERMVFELHVNTRLRPTAPYLTRPELFCRSRPLHQCTFLKRVKHLRITPRLISYEGMYPLPGVLNGLFDQLGSIYTERIVDLHVPLDSGLNYSKSSRSVNEDSWKEFLQAMIDLGDWCCVQLWRNWMLNKPLERLEQLAHAISVFVHL